MFYFQRAGTTRLIGVPHLIKHSSHIESSFPSRQRQFNLVENTHDITANLNFTNWKWEKVLWWKCLRLCARVCNGFYRVCCPFICSLDPGSLLIHPIYLKLIIPRWEISISDTFRYKIQRNYYWKFQKNNNNLLCWFFGWIVSIKFSSSRSTSKEKQPITLFQWMG